MEHLEAAQVGRLGEVSEHRVRICEVNPILEGGPLGQVLRVCERRRDAARPTEVEYPAATRSRPLQTSGLHVACEEPGQPPPSTAKVKHSRLAQRTAAKASVAFAHVPVEHTALLCQLTPAGPIPHLLQAGVRHVWERRANVGIAPRTPA